jgi:hypothetical protein
VENILIHSIRRVHIYSINHQLGRNLETLCANLQRWETISFFLLKITYGIFYKNKSGLKEPGVQKTDAVNLGIASDGRVTPCLLAQSSPLCSGSVRYEFTQMIFFCEPPKWFCSEERKNKVDDQACSKCSVDFRTASITNIAVEFTGHVSPSTGKYT